MLLYTVYTPKNPDSWNPERVYAFASIESFVNAMDLINNAKPHKGKLTPVTQKKAMEYNSLASIFTSIDKDGKPLKDGRTVLISENSVRSDWDGSLIELELTENCLDEHIPQIVLYP